MKTQTKKKVVKATKKVVKKRRQPKNYLDRKTILVHVENYLTGGYDVITYFAGGAPCEDTEYRVEETAYQHHGKNYGSGTGFGFRDFHYGFEDAFSAYGFYREMLKLVKNGKLGWVTLKPRED